jgi:Cys-tRNA(Pro)/Cys-tRNA(Cys) deacylase
VSGRGTPALVAVRAAGIDHVVHEYEAPGSAAPRERDRRPHYGLDAAAALGVDPSRVFKTLIAAVDGRLVAVVVPVAGELDLKVLAAVLDGRKAILADPVEAERATGYVVGGISPLGMRRSLPTVVDRSAADFATVFVSGGRRGLQLELAPRDLARLTQAIEASVARRD